MVGAPDVSRALTLIQIASIFPVMSRIAQPIGPAMRELQRAADGLIRLAKRPLNPEHDAYRVGSVDFASTLLTEIVHSGPGDMAARDALKEHYLDPGWPCLFVHEIEPFLYGMKVTLDHDSPEVGPALKREVRERQELALDPEYKAARGRGRRVLRMDSEVIH